MKKLFLLLLISLFLNACSSDEDTQNSDQIPTSAYKLIRVEQYDSNNNLIQDLNYTYDISFRLIEATDENLSFYYKYSDDKLISFCDSNEIPIKTYIYNGNLVSIISDNSIRSELNYNNLNQLISIESYDNQNNELFNEIINTFDDEDNVISTTNQTNNNSFNYQYDAMKNPSSLLFSDLFLKALSTGNNNVTQLTISYDPNYIELREYEYNNENFPTIEKIYINGTLNKTKIYTYDTLIN
jgi:hypothetical protein